MSAHDERPVSGARRVLGDIGTQVILENDRVRIWEVHLDPGERGDLHQHHLDHILVHIDGDRVAVESEPDSLTPWGPYLEGRVAPGDVSYQARGGIETAVNVGTKHFHEIVIELKD
jgi:beta-alanine degradation protein BauB